MLDILSLTGVIFVLIAIGYALAASSTFKPAHMQALTHYVVMLALPSLIFRAVATNPLERIINPAYMLSYLLASLLLYLSYHVWASRRHQRNAIDSTFTGMGVSCPNSGFMGYPIVLMILPSLASTALALNMIVENLSLIPLTLLLVERARHAGPLHWLAIVTIFRRLLLNPIMLGLIGGLTVSLLAIELPLIVARPVDLLAESSAAVSLIVIGGSIAGMPARSISFRLVPMICGKLLLHPLLFWLFAGVLASLGLSIGDDDLLKVGILMAAMPPMGIYPILAQRSGASDEHAVAMVLMTLCSFFTLSLLIAMLGFTLA